MRSLSMLHLFRYNKTVLQLLQNIRREEEMESSLVGLTLILCLVSCEPRKDLNNILFKIWEANQDKNIAVAPFLFRFSLCRLANVASGATKHEIMAVLNVKSDDEIKQCFLDIALALEKVMEIDMTLLNMIYVNYTSDISERFIAEARNYAVTVIKIGFEYPKAAADFVNREFESKTLKSIQGVLEPSDINSNSSVLLVNGVHLKVTWENNFNLKKTKRKIFHGKKTSDAMMMNKVQLCLYFDDPKNFYKAVSLHLAAYGTSITFLVPYPVSNLNRLMGIVHESPDFLSDLMPKMTWKETSLYLPRFKIKLALDWTPYLTAIGLNLTTSSNNTGLNAILKRGTRKNMYVSKAKQKIFIQVDEMGSVRPRTEEALRRPRNSLEVPENINDPFPEFMANRPFMFFISQAAQPEKPGSYHFELARGVFNGPDA